MTGDRWQRIEQIFDQAVQRDAGERASYLDRVCAGDSELRREVERLLQNDSANSHSLTDAVADTAGRALAPSAPGLADRPADLSGRQIGPYKVIGQIGSGGMGVV